MASKAEKDARERIKAAGDLMPVGCDLHLCEMILAELDGEREQRGKLDHALRAKDQAMSVLFDRLKAANVDYSDLIS